jgi:hypothetical protein
MLHGRRILQDLPLRQATPAWEATLVIRGLTQGQAQKCSARKMLRSIFLGGYAK